MLRRLLLLTYLSIATICPADTEYGWDFETNQATVRYAGSSEWEYLWADSSSYDINTEWATTYHDENDWKSPSFDPISENTVFFTGLHPSSITSTVPGVSVKLEGTRVQEQMGPPALTVSNIDTISIGSITDDKGNESGFRLLLDSRSDLSSVKAIYNNGGQLWFFNHGHEKDPITITTTLYVGGSKYDEQTVRYRNKGLNGDLRLEGSVTLHNTTHLIDNVRIISMKLPNPYSGYSGDITFAEDSIVYGHGYDLDLGACASSIRLPETFVMNGVITDVRSIVLGGSQLEGVQYGQVTAIFSGTVDVGSLTIANGSAATITEQAGWVDLSGNGYRGSWDYSVCFDESSSQHGTLTLGNAVVLQRNADTILDKVHGKSLGLITGSLRINVTDSDVTLQGNNTEVQNILLTMSPASALNMECLTLSSLHKVSGVTSSVLNLTDVTIELDEYETHPATMSGVLYRTGTTEECIRVSSSNGISIDYTGLAGLTIGSGSSLTFDLSSVSPGYEFIEVKFDDTVTADLSTISITGLFNNSPVPGYYTQPDSNRVEFWVAPEPTTAALALLAMVCACYNRHRRTT